MEFQDFGFPCYVKINLALSTTASVKLLHFQLPLIITPVIIFIFIILTNTDCILTAFRHLLKVWGYPRSTFLSSVFKQVVKLYEAYSKYFPKEINIFLLHGDCES